MNQLTKKRKRMHYLLTNRKSPINLLAEPDVTPKCVLWESLQTLN